MQMKELYERIGGDYASIESRLMKEEIIKMFVMKFLREPSYDNLLKAVEENDIEASFMAAHTLKGVAANLSFDRLRDVLIPLIEQLRPRTEQADKELLQKVTECYEATVAEVKKIEQ